MRSLHGRGWTTRVPAGWLLAAMLLASTASSSTRAAELAGDETVVRLASGREYQVYGDILVPVVPGPVPSSGFAGAAWPGAVVPVQFHANVSFDQKKAFLQATAQWGRESGVRVVESSTSANRILVQSGSDIGCGHSAVGRIGGVQDLVLACWNDRTILHEFGHALGLAHEHQRSDRNTYVSIQDHGVAASCGAGTFNANYGVVSSTNVLPYDYASIMHYPSNIPNMTGYYVCNGATVYATIAARGPQPPGEPSGSEFACTDIASCQAIMGAGSLSRRDKYGMALRYGYRIEVVDSGPSGVQASYTDPYQSCGSTCSTVLPGHPGFLTAMAGGGTQLLQLRGPGCSGRVCTYTARENAAFTAITANPGAANGPFIVSRSSNVAANNGSFDASYSHDRRYVAFTTLADNLAIGDDDGMTSVYVWDRTVGIVRPISVDSSGAFYGARQVAFSAVDDALDIITANQVVRMYLDGRPPVVRFDGSQTSCGLGVIAARARDTDAVVYSRRDVFENVCGSFDFGIYYASALDGSGAQRIDVDNAGNPPLGHTYADALKIAPHGRYVGFSTPVNLVPEVPTGGTVQNAYLRDVVAGTTRLVSRSLEGTAANGDSRICSITPDGRYVLFESAANDIVDLDTNGASDLFLLDTASNGIRLMTKSIDERSTNGASHCGDLTDDGRYATFSSNATNLASTLPPSGSSQVYVKDRIGGLTIPVSIKGSTFGNGANNACGSSGPTFSADGRAVLATMNASNLDPLSTTPVCEVFSMMNLFRDLLFQSGFDAAELSLEAVGDVH
jgi:hypothetical protein